MTSLLPPPSDEQMLSVILRSDFRSFVTKAFSEVEGKTLRPTNHVDLLCEVVTAVVDGRMTRVLINQPPRTLKSFIATVCHAAFKLGHDPAARVMVVCHDNRLAGIMADKIRQIMQTDWYRSAFPATILRGDFNRLEFFQTTENGYVYAVSLSSGITGQGATLIIVDDPIDAGKVSSLVELKAVINTFENKLVHRLDLRGSEPILVVMQRLHEGDLSGHLIRAGGYEQFVLPLVAEVEQSFQVGDFVWKRLEGDVLDPVRNTPAVLDELKRNPSIFRTQYQQDPRGSTEAIVPRGLIRYYDRIPDQAHHTVMSIDPALRSGGDGSHSVCLVFKTDGIKYYLCDVWRERVDYPELERKVLELVDRYGPRLVVIEDANVGPALESRTCGRLSPKSQVRMHKPTSSKHERLKSILDYVNDGRVMVPNTSTFTKGFLDEIYAFPQGEFDDQVDALSQLFRVVRDVGETLFAQHYVAKGPPPPFGKRNPMRDPKAPPRNVMARPRPRPRR